jgi:hypothetical protein
VAAWAVGQRPTLALKPLALVDPTRLSTEGRVDALRAVERQLASLHAQQQRLLAVMAEADQAAETWEQGLVVEEVACALRLSSRTGAGRLADAQLLAARPATFVLQEQGLFSPLHSRAVTDAVLGLDEPVAAKVESRCCSGPRSRRCELHGQPETRRARIGTAQDGGGGAARGDAGPPRRAHTRGGASSADPDRPPF